MMIQFPTEIKQQFNKKANYCVQIFPITFAAVYI